MDYSDNFKTQLDLEAEGVDNKTIYGVLDFVDAERLCE